MNKAEEYKVIYILYINNIYIYMYVYVDYYIII